MKRFPPMKIIRQFTSAVLLGIGALSIDPSSAFADGIFRPSKFKVTFYQIGLRQSSTGVLNPILDSGTGVEVDLSNPGDSLSLASGKEPRDGKWDQIYALVSNRIKVAGTDGNGCFIRSGAAAAFTNGTSAIVTANAAQSGEATTISEDYGTPGDFGPYTPSITSSVNGTSTSDLKEYLVSSTNPTPNGGGSINRFLYIGSISPVTINSGSRGSVIYTIDTSQAGQISGNCGGYSYGNLQFNMSIQQD